MVLGLLYEQVAFLDVSLYNLAPENGMSEVI